MIAYIKHRKGQSIWDLCLQSYGTLDLLVKFCNDNGVTNLQNIPQQVNYQYDTALVKFEGNPNIYHTLYGTNPEENLITEDAQFNLTTEDETEVLITETNA